MHPNLEVVPEADRPSCKKDVKHLVKERVKERVKESEETDMSKNSIGKILAGFEWDYDGPVRFVTGKGYQGKGISRTMFLTPSNLADIPEELFAVKISQSVKPERAGKPVFRFFSYRFTPGEGKFEDLAPTGITMDTPLADIKNLVVSKFSNLPTQVEASLAINLHGRFTNLQCSDGVYALYDEDKFKDPDPEKNGRAPYWIKNDTQVHVKLKGAESQGNEYLQSTLSTTASANEVFQKAVVGKVWEGADMDTGAAAGAAAAPEAPATPATPNPADFWK